MSKQGLVLSEVFVAFLLFTPLVSAAGVDGVWQVKAQSDEGPREAKLTLKEEAGKLTGALLLDNGKEISVKGSRTGDAIELVFDHASDTGETREARLSGKLEGETMSGAWDTGAQRGSWTATRAQ